MGRSLQLLTQVGSTQFSKCVSLPSSSSSSPAPSLRTLIFTRKSVKGNVVVSSKGSARTTDHAITVEGTGRATRAMSGVTTARRTYYYHKREAEADPTAVAEPVADADADADAYYGYYGHGLGY